MIFNPPLLSGRLIERYKRFFARVDLEGKEVLAHCPNTGRLLDGCTPGQKVFLLPCGADKKRTLAYRWMVNQDDDGTFVGVDPLVPNKLFKEAFTQKLWPWLNEWTMCQPEIAYENVRFDFLLRKDNGQTAFVELKNVHYKVGTTAFFPDTPTLRGQKHLRILTQLAKENQKVYWIYIVQRGDVDQFSLAADIDPLYADLAQKAYGVEMKAYSCHVNEAQITLDKCLPIV